jgi:hypothetical protein
MTRVDDRLLGDAGEYFVALQLARRGICPTTLSRNTKTFDLTATANGKTLNIQVKTSAGRNHDRSWYVGKNKPNPSDDFIYFFVNMWDDENRLPEYFIVPSCWVIKDPALDRDRPKFYLRDNEDKKFKENWKPVMEYLAG